MSSKDLFCTGFAIGLTIVLGVATSLFATLCIVDSRLVHYGHGELRAIPGLLTEQSGDLFWAQVSIESEIATRC